MTIARPKTDLTNKLAGLGLFALVLYILLPQIKGAKGDFSLVKTGNAEWLTLAFIISWFVPVFIALVYDVLAKSPLKFWTSLLVTESAYIANAIVPSGLGGMALFTYYLHKAGHTIGKAGAVIAAYEIVDFASYIILGICAIILSGTDLSNIDTNVSVPQNTLLFIGIALIAIIIILWRWGSLRSKIRGGLNAVKADIGDYFKQPMKLVQATAYSALNSTMLVLVLYACCHAYGIDITIAQCFVAYILGTVLGTAVPTPGGLGGVEAGLYAGITSFGYSGNETFVAVMAYRLFTFWIPLIPGYISLSYLRRGVLSGFKL